MIVMHPTEVSVRERTRLTNQMSCIAGLAWTLLVFRLLLVGLRIVSRRRFDHAVDNFGDSVGLVANWVAVTRRRRSYPLAAGSSGGDPDYQPRHGSQSRLIRKDPCYLWL